ncbi:type II toxin-antitoxin system HicA family toxin [Limnochorda pilosa]|uniref:type II toxin-antitoxin system HicA family toxin n=1 Tax=Limnochorda pilosa TaxID=1555112 RepID=UPI0009E91C5F
MKRGALLRHLRKHGCVLKREGRSHSLWMNPQTGAIETIPRHVEIPDKLARKICRGLSVPEVGQFQ